ncbi:glycosyltransferase [Microbacterium sp. ABRD28]|uniref:glycosyltransferase n=1 Tax=Microbacterium sp. ABRD28 TaxID=2268461 RepID=UPI000F559A15|nr:glycosyltransferase [Microbacterium sp. ABRD28]AZC13462.1 glycosyltransferase [Microbacterium sp. ABRD28]
MTEARSSGPQISVCVATYNGAAFVSEQLLSILDQLSPSDEVVVVDDASSDDTVARIEALVDPRIRVIALERNAGYVRAFERAISEARGHVVFLSDQDDRWLPNRVRDMMEALTEAALVVSNFSVFGGTATFVQSRRLRAQDSSRNLRNLFWIWIGLRPYYGCCMAFRAELTPRLLPFPAFLSETHDQWIGMVGNASRSVIHLERDTIARRVHAGNASARGNRPLRTILAARVMMARAMVEAIRRGGRRTPTSG